MTEQIIMKKDGRVFLWQVALSFLAIAIFIGLINSFENSVLLSPENSQGAISCSAIKEQYSSDVVEFSCSDTDEGNDAKNLGAIYGYVNGQWYCTPDKCESGIMKEYFCIGRRAVYEKTAEC